MRFRIISSPRAADEGRRASGDGCRGGGNKDAISLSPLLTLVGSGGDLQRFLDGRHDFPRT